MKALDVILFRHSLPFSLTSSFAHNIFSFLVLLHLSSTLKKTTFSLIHILNVETCFFCRENTAERKKMLYVELPTTTMMMMMITENKKARKLWKSTDRMLKKIFLIPSSYYKKRRKEKTKEANSQENERRCLYRIKHYILPNNYCSNTLFYVCLYVFILHTYTCTHRVCSFHSENFSSSSHLLMCIYFTSFLSIFPHQLIAECFSSLHCCFVFFITCLLINERVKIIKVSESSQFAGKSRFFSFNVYWIHMLDFLAQQLGADDDGLRSWKTKT